MKNVRQIEELFPEIESTCGDEDGGAAPVRLDESAVRLHVEGDDDVRDEVLREPRGAEAHDRLQVRRRGDVVH